MDHAVLEARQGAGMIAETHLDLRELERGYMAGLTHHLELSLHAFSERLLSPSSIGEPERAKQPRPERRAWTEFQSSPERILGRLEFAPPCTRQSEKPVRAMKLRVERERAAKVHGGSVEAFTERMRHPEVGNDRRRER